MQASPTSTKRRFVAMAGAALMAATNLVFGAPAVAGPREDAARAIRHLDADTARLRRDSVRLQADTARKQAELTRLKKQGDAADKITQANEAALACYDKLNQTIVAEGGVAKLSPARRTALRAVRNQCDSLAATSS